MTPGFVFQVQVYMECPLECIIWTIPYLDDYEFYFFLNQYIFCLEETDYYAFSTSYFCSFQELKKIQLFSKVLL